jgi:hypothetical protein
LFSTSDATLVERFGKTAFLKKGLFKLPQLLVQKVVGLMDKAH